MPDKHENLEQVLGNFLDGPELQNAIDDIGAGDRLLAQNPAPRPSARLLERINADVASALAHRRHRRRRMLSIGRSVAAAAAIVMVASMLFFSGHVIRERPGTHPGVAFAARGWWDDNAVEGMSSAVDDVFQTMLTIGSHESYTEQQIPDFIVSGSDEPEFIAISDPFWKG